MTIAILVSSKPGMAFILSLGVSMTKNQFSHIVQKLIQLFITPVADQPHSSPPLEDPFTPTWILVA